MENIRNCYIDLSILTFAQVQKVVNYLTSINEVLFPLTLRRLNNEDNFLEIPSKNNDNYLFFDGDASFENFLNVIDDSVIKLNHKRIKVQIL